VEKLFVMSMGRNIFQRSAAGEEILQAEATARKEEEVQEAGDLQQWTLKSKEESQLKEDRHLMVAEEAVAAGVKEVVADNFYVCEQEADSKRVSLFFVLP
jgi:hypothetical protein